MANSSSPDPANVETCRIRRWRGYVKSTFYAVTDAGEVLAESTTFRWGKAAPPPETSKARAAYNQLVDTLEAEGWKKAAPGTTTWFDATFVRPLAGAAPTAATHGHRAPQPWPRRAPAEPGDPHRSELPPSAFDLGQEGGAEP